MAIVELDEDPSLRFFTRIVEGEPESLRVGMQVEVVFVDVDGQAIPCWQPIAR